MRIRDAKKADLAEIVRIYNATIPSRMVTADIVPITVESRILWFEAHTPNHRPIWVAESDGKMAGWISFEPFKTRPAYDHTAEISIYLDEQFRRQGIGKQLLEAALAKAPDLGIHSLLGYIFAHNTPSLALFNYKRHQFPHLAVVCC